MTLPTRTLGQTGLEVSCLGLGTVKFGRNTGVKYPSGFELPSDQDIRALLSQARNLGINLLDTAPAYGSSEARLGSLLTDRQQWLLCTKVGEEFEDGRSHFDFSSAHTRRSVERSLRRLGTDYLDLVLVHSDGNDLAILEQGDCLDMLQQLKQAGLVRAIGMSSKSVDGGLAAVAHCDVVMVTYNPSTTADAPVIDRAAELNKGVLIKKALDSGRACVGEDGQAAGPAYNLAFALNRPGVSSVIIGTLNPDHLAENAAAAEAALSGMT